MLRLMCEDRQIVTILPVAEQTIQTPQHRQLIEKGKDALHLQRGSNLFCCLKYQADMGTSRTCFGVRAQV